MRRGFDRKEAREGMRGGEDRESVHGGRDFWAPANATTWLSCAIYILSVWISAATSSFSVDARASEPLKAYNHKLASDPQVLLFMLGQRSIYLEHD